MNLAVKKNYKVTALMRNGSHPRVPLPQNIQICRGNLTDNYSANLRECDVFVHCASEGVVKNSSSWEKCFDVNFVQSNQIISHALENGVKKFIICGTCFEYGASGDEYEKLPTNALLKPIGAYSTSKAAAGLYALNLAKAYNVKMVLARLFHVYGRGDHPERFWPKLINAAKNNINFEMTLGEQVRNFIDVELASLKILDIALSFDKLVNGGLIKNIGSDLNLTLLEFANMHWENIGSRAKIINGALEYREKEVMRYVPKL